MKENLHFDSFGMDFDWFCHTFHTNNVNGHWTRTKIAPNKDTHIQTEAKILKMHEQMAPIHRHYITMRLASSSWWTIMLALKYVLNGIQCGLYVETQCTQIVMHEKANVFFIRRIFDLMLLLCRFIEKLYFQLCPAKISLLKMWR